MSLHEASEGERRESGLNPDHYGSFHSPPSPVVASYSSESASSSFSSSASASSSRSSSLGERSLLLPHKDIPTTSINEMEGNEEEEEADSLSSESIIQTTPRTAGGKEDFVNSCWNAIASTYFEESLHLQSHLASTLVNVALFLNYTFSVVGGVLADEKLGQFSAVALGSLVAFLALIIFFLSELAILLWGPPHSSTHSPSSSTSGSVSVFSTDLDKYIHPGFAFLAVFLFIIGNGITKPCISVLIGDQFLPGQEKERSVYFSYYYLSVQFGAVVPSVALPIILQETATPVETFAILVGGMLLALIVFFWGRKQYRRVPVKGSVLSTFLKVIWTAISLRKKEERKRKKRRKVVSTTNGGPPSPPYIAPFSPDRVNSPTVATAEGGLLAKGVITTPSRQHKPSRTPSRPLRIPNPSSLLRRREEDEEVQISTSHWLDAARGKFPSQTIENVKSMLRVLIVFLPLPFFWAIFFQMYSLWILTATSMNRVLFGFEIPAANITAINGTMDIFLIPLFSKLLYPFIDNHLLPGLSKLFRYNLGKFTPLRKIGAGHVFTAAASVVAGFVKMWVANSPGTVSILWILPQFFLISCAEILLAVTAFEFAYTQAPKELKGMTTACFLLTPAGGNGFAALLGLVPLQYNEIMDFAYADGVGLVFLLFLLIAINYTYVPVEGEDDFDDLNQNDENDPYATKRTNIDP